MKPRKTGACRWQTKNVSFRFSPSFGFHQRVLSSKAIINVITVSAHSYFIPAHFAWWRIVLTYVSRVTTNRIIDAYWIRNRVDIYTPWSIINATEQNKLVSINVFYVAKRMHRVSRNNRRLSSFINPIVSLTKKRRYIDNNTTLQSSRFEITLHGI